MTLPQEPERAFARVERNVTAGRDFVVGDVHGEFDTLEAMLASVGFRPGRDRLFALGDLVDRGPRSADALAWMENGQIELSVRGNHEQMLLDRIDAAESDREGRTPRTAHTARDGAPVVRAQRRALKLGEMEGNDPLDAVRGHGGHASRSDRAGARNPDLAVLGGHAREARGR